MLVEPLIYMHQQMQMIGHDGKAYHAEPVVLNVSDCTPYHHAQRRETRMYATGCELLDHNLAEILTSGGLGYGDVIFPRRTVIVTEFPPVIVVLKYCFRISHVKYGDRLCKNSDYCCERVEIGQSFLYRRAKKVMISSYLCAILLKDLRWKKNLKWWRRP